MLLDVTPFLTPVFAVLTALIVLPAAAFAVAALRSRRRRGREATRAAVRVELRPADGARARSA